MFQFHSLVWKNRLSILTRILPEFVIMNIIVPSNKRLISNTERLWPEAARRCAFWMTGAPRNNTCMGGNPRDTAPGAQETSRLLFEKRPALYFCNYKENKKNNIRMLDTLLIEDFIDSMEEYFYF